VEGRGLRFAWSHTWGAHVSHRLVGLPTDSESAVSYRGAFVPFGIDCTLSSGNCSAVGQYALYAVMHNCQPKTRSGAGVSVCPELGR
jgi:hypothetical protein